MYYFSDNTNNDDKNVYYGGFASETECRFYGSFHRDVAGISANDENCLGTGFFTQEEVKDCTDYDGYVFKPANKAKYPKEYTYAKVKQSFKRNMTIDKDFNRRVTNSTK